MLEDLWPGKLEPVKTRPPVAILREQASLLGAKTKNIIEGRVESYSDVFDESTDMKYSFFVVASTLNYSYRLFTITHDIRMYPLTIKMDTETYEEVNPKKPGGMGVGEMMRRQRNEVQANNEENLTEILKKIFASRKTIQIIGAMLAQSTS